MKFTNNGSITFGGEIESKGFFGKLISKIKGEKEDEINGGFRTTFDYEQSLEISTGELAELFDKSKDYDVHSLEILGKLKKGLFNFEEELRERAATAIPEWQDICHKAQVKDWEQREEYINLGKEEK